MIIMAAIAACIIVAAVEWVFEAREDRFDRRNAAISKAQRHRMVQDAQQHQINQDWRKAG